jgi:hypothetical protein
MTRAIPLLFLLTEAVRAQSGGPLQPGQSIPDFELRDQSGRSRKFEDLSGPRGAMLVFYRSADW